MLEAAGLPAPAFGTATTQAGARDTARRIGFPVLVRPSYVLGGRGMEIVYSEPQLDEYVKRALDNAADGGRAGTLPPLLIDRFLDDAIEIDVDALFDGTELFLGGVMEHIEEAGIHSGDSACTLPPVTLSTSELERIRLSTEAIARGVGVHGLLNIQFALVSDVLYVLEANPRASRTVPFVSKATGVSLAKAAALVMAGRSIADLRAMGILPVDDASVLDLDSPIAVKEAVLPFKRFRTKEGVVVDTVLGPEMRSTGEVMGFDVDFPTAFAKSQDAAFGGLPTRRARLHLGGRPRQALDRLPGQAPGRAGLRDPRDRGHRGGPAPQRHRVERGPQVLVGPRRRRGSRRSSTSSPPARSTSW